MTKAQRFVWFVVACVLAFLLAVIACAGLYALAWRYA